MPTKKAKKTNGAGKPYIVTAGREGRAVLYGRADEPPVAGQPFSLRGARMVLYWDSACGGLLGLAAKGPKGSTRITAAIPHHADECARQVLGVTDEAAAAIDAWEDA